jgi:hypothetical protein
MVRHFEKPGASSLVGNIPYWHSRACRIVSNSSVVMPNSNLFKSDSWHFLVTTFTHRVIIRWADSRRTFILFGLHWDVWFNTRGVCYHKMHRSIFCVIHFCINNQQRKNSTKPSRQTHSLTFLNNEKGYISTTPNWKVLFIFWLFVRFPGPYLKLRSFLPEKIQYRR